MDINQICENLDVIFEISKGKHEITHIGKKGVNTIGFFDNVEEALNAIRKSFGKREATNVYIGYNPVKESYVNASRPKEDDIESLTCLMLDLDSKNKIKADEKTYFCASQDEIETINECSEKIVEYLKEFNLTPSYKVFTGNGYQLAYFFNAQSKDKKTLLGEIIDGLNVKFSDLGVDIDRSLKDANRLCRLAGFLNKKKDRVEKIEEQRIYRIASLEEVSYIINDWTCIEALGMAIEANKPVKPEKVVQSITQIAQKVHPTVSNIPVNNVNPEDFLREYIQYHSLDVIKEIYNNGHQYLLKECPFDTSHVETARLGVSTDGKLFFKCFHNSCQNKTWHDVKSIYPTPEKTIFCKQCDKEVIWRETVTGWTLFELNGNVHKCKLYREFTPLTESELAPYKINNFPSEMFVEFKECKVIKASTGLGKTYTAAMYLVDLAEKDMSSVFLTSTTIEVQKIYKLITTLLLNKGKTNEQCRELVCKLGASSQEEEGVEDKDSESEELIPAKILIAPFAYLSRKGDTERPYKMAKAIVKGRTVIIDECQDFFDLLRKEIPLSYLYRPTSVTSTKDYCLVTGCPIACRNAKSCAKCVRHLSMITYDNLKSTRGAYLAPKRDMEGTDFATKPQTPYKIKGLDETTAWTLAYGNIFFKNIAPSDIPMAELSDCIEKEIFTPSEVSLENYVNSLVKFAYQAKLKVLFPTKEGLPILPEDISPEDVIKYPKEACLCPILTTIDRFPLVNLFSNGDRVILMSATIPEKFIEVLKDTCQKSGFVFLKPVEIETITHQYDITLLLSTKRFSPQTYAKILCDVHKKGKKFVMFSDTKASMKTIYHACDKIDEESAKDFRVYGLEHRFFNQAFDGKDSVPRTFLTHSLGTLSRGVDIFRGFDGTIVNACHFKPQFSLFDLNEHMSKEDIKKLLLAEIKQNLTQIMGRLLRSEVERKEGEIVKDLRKIVIVLLGVDEDLTDTHVDSKLCYSQKSYVDTFMYDKQRATSMQIKELSRAIDCVFAGEEIPDIRMEGIQRLVSKASNTLSKQQREAIKEERILSKEETKMLKLIGKAQALKQEGKKWKEIWHTLNVARLTNEQREILKAHLGTF